MTLPRMLLLNSVRSRTPRISSDVRMNKGIGKW